MAKHAAKPAPQGRRYWLLKTEPETFSIDDLRGSPQETTRWDGVRNYQARNFLRDDMAVGDGVFIYHSRARVLAIVGTAEVVRAGYPDPAQFDPNSIYADAKSAEASPRWYAVDVRLTQIFARPVARDSLRALPALADMMLLRPGSRLSVQPVSAQAWGLILALSRG